MLPGHGKIIHSWVLKTVKEGRITTTRPQPNLSNTSVIDFQSLTTNLAEIRPEPSTLQFENKCSTDQAKGN